MLKSKGRKACRCATIQKNKWPGQARPSSNRRSRVCEKSLHRPYFDNVRHEMLEQILDAMLQRCRRGWAARAGALHVEENDAVLEAAEGDVAAVAGDRRADAGFQNVLDDADRFGVGFIEEFLGVGLGIGRGTVGQDWRTGHVVFHDGAEDGGLEMLPVAVVR